MRRILKMKPIRALYLQVWDTVGKVNVTGNRKKGSNAKRPREEWCPAQVPAIIDRQTWEEVQYLREARRMRPKGHCNTCYGMVRCGVAGCGCTMHGNRVKEKDTERTET